MTTATRGLIRYEGPITDESPRGGRAAHGHDWQGQVDVAASYLAAAALAGHFPSAGAMSERQLARHLASQVARKRRMGAAKLVVIVLGEILALAAGCYIGLIA